MKVLKSLLIIVAGALFTALAALPAFVRFIWSISVNMSDRMGAAWNRWLKSL